MSLIKDFHLDLLLTNYLEREICVCNSTFERLFIFRWKRFDVVLLRRKGHLLYPVTGIGKQFLIETRVFFLFPVTDVSEFFRRIELTWHQFYIVFTLLLFH